MNTLKVRSALLIALALMTSSRPAVAAEKPSITNDLAQLQGTWTMVSGSADGQAMPDEMRKQMKRVCKGDETTTTMNGQIYLKAKFTLNPTRTPKTIDYEMT